MPFLIAILVKRGMTAQMAKVAILITAAILILAGIWLAIALHDRRVITDYETDTTGRLIVKNADATVEAAERRAQDEALIANQAKDDRDAISTLPDTAPDAHSIALSCARLRRAGTDTNRIAACAGFDRTP